MDATSTPLKTQPLLHKIAQDNPSIAFIAAEDFHWSPHESTVYYCESEPFNIPKLLHELAHALLQHRTYQFDIELIHMESQAWTYAQTTLAEQYEARIDNDIIEDALETYRCWLHTRSLCPQCRSNGIQTQTGPYKCLACGCQWRANEARICELRRFTL